MNCSIACSQDVAPADPPTHSAACAVVFQGNNSEHLQYCAGGGPIGYYGTGDCPECFAYVNLTEGNTNVTVFNCLTQLGVGGDVVECSPATPVSAGARHGTNKVFLGILMSMITTGILVLNW